MAKNDELKLTESRYFSNCQVATFVRFAPRVSATGDVYASEASKGEKRVSYDELKVAVMRARKF